MWWLWADWLDGAGEGGCSTKPWYGSEGVAKSGYGEVLNWADDWKGLIKVGSAKTCKNEFQVESIKRAKDV